MVPTFAGSNPAIPAKLMKKGVLNMDKIDVNPYLAKMGELSELSKPLVEYLKKHYHPYVKIEITNSAISVVEEMTRIPIECEEV